MRGLRFALPSAPLAVVLSLSVAGTSLGAAAYPSFASSYAVEDKSAAYSGGSVTYKAGSGITNYLRATAQGDVFTFGAIILVSSRAGGITSSAKRYTGPTGGSLRYTIRGSFSRELTGGFSLMNGAYFDHVIAIGLVNVSTGKVVHSWTLADETILCGGLVYPVGVGGCNGTASDTYPTSGSRTARGTGIVYGHYYAVRVITLSVIQAGGIAGGMQARTTAHSLSATLSW